MESVVVTILQIKAEMEQELQNFLYLNIEHKKLYTTLLEI